MPICVHTSHVVPNWTGIMVLWQRALVVNELSVFKYDYQLLLQGVSEAMNLT